MALYCNHSACMEAPLPGRRLCRFHLEQKRERQRRTAQQKKCPCGNVATHGDSLCGRCRGEAGHQEKLKQTLTLVERVERLEKMLGGLTDEPK